MKNLTDEIKLTIEMMQGDIDDGAHGELQSHLYSLLEMKRELLGAFANIAKADEHCQHTLIGKRAGGGIIIGFEGDDAIIMASSSWGPMNWFEAFEFCEAVTLGKNNDWRLPTKDQLNLAWVNREKLGDLGLDNCWHWSASNSSSNGAECQYFFDGLQGYHYKDNLYRVRPVRIVKIEDLELEAHPPGDE